MTHHLRFHFVCNGSFWTEFNCGQEGLREEGENIDSHVHKEKPCFEKNPIKTTESFQIYLDNFLHTTRCEGTAKKLFCFLQN